MSVLLSSLREELATVERLEKKYASKLAHGLKGSFVLRKRGARAYGYLTFRDGRKVKQQYLGVLTEAEIARYRSLTDDRKRQREQLRNVKEQKRILRRALR